MTEAEFYELVDQSLALILDHIEQIAYLSQAFLIICCGCVLYHLFWGRK